MFLFFEVRKKSWSGVFEELFSNPAVFIQNHIWWVISVLVILFMLSRINNYLEITGVNRAIYVTRGIVSSITAFIIAPIAFILLINGIALVNGYQTIGLRPIWEWIWLTMTSYFWLMKCFFGGGIDQVKIYDINSLIRVLWITLPVIFVWFRATSGMFMRALLIPFIIGVFFVTQHKVAEPTFLNKHILGDKAKRYVPTSWIPDNPPKLLYPERHAHLFPEYEYDVTTNPTNSNTRKTTTTTNPIVIETDEEPAHDRATLSERQAQFFNIALITGLIIALFVGFILKKQQLALILLLATIMGFFFLSRITSSKPVIMQSERTVRAQNELDTLWPYFVNLHDQVDGSSVRLYNHSLRLNELFKVPDVYIPENLCDDYQTHFYDLCHELNR